MHFFGVRARPSLPPSRVEGIRVDRSLTDEVCIEADFRWSGDANIFLAIELPAGGNATRMVPKARPCSPGSLCVCVVCVCVCGGGGGGGG